MTSNAEVETNTGALASDAPPPTSAEDIRRWLSAKVAELLSVDPAKLDAAESFTNYGLSSISGVMLSGDIEHWLSLKLSPTLAWEYPSVELLTRHLVSELNLTEDARAADAAADGESLNRPVAG
jgi:acyl carrier protein